MTFRSRRIIATAQQPVENLNKTLFNGWVQFFDLTTYKKTTAGATGAKGPIVTPRQDGEGTRVSVVDGQFATDLTVSADSDTDEYRYKWLLSDGQQGEFNLSWTTPAATGPGSDIVFGNLWPPTMVVPAGTTPVFIGDNVSQLVNDVPYGVYPTGATVDNLLMAGASPALADSGISKDHGTFSDVVYARNYGFATTNTGAQNKTALEAALAAMPNGGTLIIAPGIYNYDGAPAGTATAIPANVALVGPGATIRNANSGEYLIRVLTANVRLDGLAFDANGANYALQVGDTATDVAIVDCQVTGANRTGLSIRGTRINVVRGRYHNNTQVGVAVIAGQQIALEGVTADNNSGASPQSGITCEPNATEAIDGLAIIDCYTSGNGADGVRVASGTGYDNGPAIDNVTIRGGVHQNNGQYQILVDRCGSVQIEAVTAYSNASQVAIFCSQNLNVEVFDCTVSSSGGAGALGCIDLAGRTFAARGNTILSASNHGLRLAGSPSTGNAHSVTVHDNRVFNTGDRGIYFGPNVAVNGGSIKNNVVIGAQAEGLSIRDLTTKNMDVQGNIFAGCARNGTTAAQVEVSGDGGKFQGNMVRKFWEYAVGTAAAGTTTSVTLETGNRPDVTGSYIGDDIEITGGTGSGQVSKVTAYDGATGIATVSPAFGTAPDNTSTYRIGVQTMRSGSYDVDIPSNANAFWFKANDLLGCTFRVHPAGGTDAGDSRT